MNMYGFTWVFAIFTFTDGSFAFQLLFAIFNSLQGFFMFIFFCVLGKEAREAWARVLCRGKLKKFAPPTSTASRPGAPRGSSAQTNTRRRYSAATEVRSAGNRSQGYDSDTLRSVTSSRAEVSGELSSVSISEGTSTVPDLIEFNNAAVNADTLERSHPSQLVKPMLTLHEEVEDGEEECESEFAASAHGDVESLSSECRPKNLDATSEFTYDTIFVNDAVEPPFPFRGGDSASISGASLAESGIMVNSPREMSPPQHHQEQEVRDSPMLGVHEGQRVEETSDDQTTEDHSEVVTNPHAF